MDTPKTAPVAVEAAEREKFEEAVQLGKIPHVPAHITWKNDDCGIGYAQHFAQCAWSAWKVRAELARPLEVAAPVGVAREPSGGHSTGFTNEKGEAVNVGASARGNHTIDIDLYREDEKVFEHSVSSLEAQNLAKAMASVCHFENPLAASRTPVAEQGGRGLGQITEVLDVGNFRGVCMDATSGNRAVDNPCAQALVEPQGNAVQDGKDARLFEWLKNLKCNSLSLSRDDDKACNYMTAEQWIDEHVEDFSDCDPSDVQRMKDTNTIWRLQIYPNTPVGFNVWFGSTAEGCIDAAILSSNDRTAV